MIYDRRKFLGNIAKGVIGGISGCGFLANICSCQVQKPISKAKARKPNIVILLADDLGYGDLGCFGNTYIQTPNIDKMAAEGVRLTDFYVDSPVCSPTRASLITGRCPQRNGLTNVIEDKDRKTHLDNSEVLLPQALKKAGYATGLIGKWHIGESEGSRPNDRGYDYFFGGLLGGIDYFTHEFGNRGNILQRNNESVNRSGRYITELISEESVDFINCNSNSPFFLLVSFFSPHTAVNSEGKFGMLQAPEEQIKKYAPHGNPSRQQLYAAMVSGMDKAVGEIMKSLKSNGIEEETFVFFTSDNGPDPYPKTNGSSGKLKGYKHTLWEGGIRVPAIARWPGNLPLGAERHSYAVTSDLFATILSVANVKCPKNLSLDGKDITSILKADRQPEKRNLYWSYIRDTSRISREKAVRSGKWKWLNGELYDLENDPGETKDISTDYPDIAAGLANDWNKWLAMFPHEKQRWGNRLPLRFIEP